MKIIMTLIFAIAAIAAQAQSPAAADTSHTDKIYTVVERMPEYPGGSNAMVKFITENIKYPDMEWANDITGRVIVGFIVNQDGSLSDITVKKGVSSALDKEAVRVIKAMPKFIPGYQNGQPVRVKYIIPIKFSLTDSTPAPKGTAPSSGK